MRLNGRYQPCQHFAPHRLAGRRLGRRGCRQRAVQRRHARNKVFRPAPLWFLSSAAQHMDHLSRQPIGRSFLPLNLRTQPLLQLSLQPQQPPLSPLPEQHHRLNPSLPRDAHRLRLPL